MKVAGKRLQPGSAFRSGGFSLLELMITVAVAAILMALALLINLAASLTGRYFKKRRSL